MALAEGILIREISARITAANGDGFGDVEIVLAFHSPFSPRCRSLRHFDDVAGLRGIHRRLDGGKVRPAGLADMPFVHLRQKNCRA